MDLAFEAFNKTLSSLQDCKQLAQSWKVLFQARAALQGVQSVFDL